MAWQRSSLKQLYERIASDIDAYIPGARLVRSVLDYLARIYAGAVDGLYSYIEYLSLQILPDSASENWLDRHASIWGLARRPALPARGRVRFSGANGAAISSGTRLVIGELEYQTDASAFIAAGIAEVAVTAVAAGLGPNQPVNSELRLIAPLDGVNISARAVTALEGGLEVEEDESLRTRLLFLIRNKPHGGAAHDYVFWALDQAAHGVPVTRAWPYPQAMGPGTVTVRAVCDGRANVALTPAELTAVKNYIDGVRPVTVKEFYILSPALVPLNLTIRLAPDTAETRAAVIAELQDLLFRDAEPGKTILISRIREAVSIAAGENDNEVISPTANVTYAANQMAILGTITWGAAL